MTDIQARIHQIIEQAEVPLYPEQVAAHMPEEEYAEMVVSAEMMWMAEMGLLVMTKRKKYAVPEQMGYVAGTVQMHPKGYAFVICNDRTLDDIFIPADGLRDAMNRDTVLVHLLKNTGGKKHSREGEVVKILSRANKSIIGTFEEEESAGFVIPDDRRITQSIYVPASKTTGARDGDKVIIAITKWPHKRRNAEGEVTQVLGRSGDPGIDILSIIKQFNLPDTFEEEVLIEAKQAMADGIRSGLKQEKRIDLRQTKMVTIDGADAKDLDDAVSITKIAEGYQLGVHIADVSHYVREDGALDETALERGTSVYLIDRVIPMLPKELSNGICSLNAGEDRLALSVMMDVDEKGKVFNYQIFSSIICVAERMTYADVTAILTDRSPQLLERYKDLIETFECMQELAEILQIKRRGRGSVDFALEECKITLDANGKPTDIRPYERGISNRIIEEFMLLCNETIAEHIYWAELPFVYRIHENPSIEKMHALTEFLNHLGYTVRKDERLKSIDFQKIIERATGKPEEHVISSVMLRSMQKARYSVANHGHFGLAAEYYCHFTSPIRRYPDLIIHRIIKQSLEGSLNIKAVKALEDKLPAIAEHCSQTERTAQEAERAVDDLKKAEYMQERIGQQYDGIISGLTAWGMYVELDNTVEGMIRLSSMDDDYYIYHEKTYCIEGERTHKLWRLGDKVRIQVHQVSIQDRTIDFIIADAPTKAGKRG